MIHLPKCMNFLSKIILSRRILNAIRKNSPENLKPLLLRKEFPIDEPLNYGMTPLSLSAYYGSLECTKILFELGADPNKKDEETGSTPLIHAVLRTESKDLLSFLLSKGADPNLKDNNGFGPLHHCLNDAKLESFQFLLEKGADPNLQDKDGVTCLNLAKSSHGMSDFIDLLLKYGADPNIKDKHGKTYLM
ncbi:hypothetical protein CH373_17995 [Leptospira perolatii]|uniref:Uncharacterized protein n=1 Tax=Leptospira perolatii TaxID=2023191 RepID=A0A2M9ZI48_9LEPT|nr:ankyrin repeat domain-containing protein [Leptospira perolatii]PJZ68110.1 hypothetical protein CH360_17935 [Leptospira perolatii]PJZ71729.1 hypothetical protein CH373_17995 [Leptospira perolatii]